MLIVVYATGNFISNCDIKVKWENTMVFTCKFKEYHGRPICSLIKLQNNSLSYVYIYKKKTWPYFC